MPRRPWVLGQSWRHVLFAHWDVDPARVRDGIPPGLELDTHDGRAWLTLAAFVMSDVRPRFTPPLPGVSTFLETNVRTYVRHRGRPGVYFFSLDATSRPAVLAARALARLPYRAARGRFRVDGHTRRYAMQRVGARPAAGVRAVYRPTGESRPATADVLDRFLLERYCLYVVAGSGTVWRTDIQHPPWKVRDARGLLHHDRLLPREVGSREAVLHFADRQDVLTWLPTAA